MSPEELRAQLDTLVFVEAGSNKSNSDEDVFCNYSEDAEDVEAREFMEQCEIAEIQGVLYADSMDARDYVAEMGDPRSALTDLYAVHPGLSIPAETMADHPLTQVAQALSDEINQSKNFY